MKVTWHLLSIAWLAALWPRDAAAVRPVAISLPDFMRQVRGFMPAEGSNGYVIPSSEDRQAFQTAATSLKAGDVARAEQALAAYPDFEVLDLTDPSGDRYLALAEKPPIPRGWGFFLFAQAPARPSLILEMPHPLADRDSELAGASAGAALHPAALLFAGAHRYADPRHLSDVAHTPLSIFETVHEVLLDPGRVVIQVHGFSAASHVGYPELVLSNGTTAPDAGARDLCAAILRGGVGCSLFDGTAYADLGAQQNVQGASTRAALGDGHFLHMETAEPIRDQPDRLQVLIDAIAARWPARPGTSGSCTLSPEADRPGFLPAGVAVVLLLVRRRRSRSSEGESE
jgi:MYXO-CTERM domain-containing protein